MESGSVPEGKGKGSFGKKDGKKGVTSEGPFNGSSQSGAENRTPGNSKK